MPPSKRDKNDQNSWMKYAGMSTQIGGAIVLGVLLGRWLDGYFDTTPTLTVVLALVGVFAGLYLALKDFL